MYSNLFSPVRIGGTLIPNRIVLAPINTGLAFNHEVSDQLVDFHVRIASSGVGLTIIGATAVANEGFARPNKLSLDEDNKIEGFARLVNAIKESGSVCAVQLSHAGTRIDSTLCSTELVSPSGVPKTLGGRIPHALSIFEIERIVEQFGLAARRAFAAGVDMVEIQCAHGFLINQFLSPLFNIRVDEYGGDLKSRTRFALEIIRSIKYHTGPLTNLICRISGSELIEGGLDISDMELVAKWFQDEGVQAIDVSGGIQRLDTTPGLDRPPAVYSEFASRIKRNVTIPVLVAGRITTLDIAERVILDQKADLVAMARAFISDPFLIRKTLNREITTIASCTYCGMCNYSGNKQPHIICPLNDYLLH